MTSAKKISSASSDDKPGTIASIGSDWSPESKFDFWRTAHRALKGQYRFAALLAASGTVLGAIVGSQLGQRVYSSTGLVRIASVLPQVMHETDQNRPMAMFDGFIAAQRDVMLSRDVIQAALQEEPWRRAQRTGLATSDAQFAANLKVETRPRSDHLKVIFTDKDPAIAAAGVRSIIAAYQRTYVYEQDRVESQRLEELQVRRASLTAQLQKLQAQAGPDANGLTAAEIEPACNAAAECEKKLRAALVDAQCAIAGVPDLSEHPAASERLPEQTADDDLLRTYADAQARSESDLATARAGGLGAAHPRIIQLEEAATQNRQRLEDFIRDCDASRANSAAAPPPVSLTQRETNLRHLVDSTEQEIKRLVARRAQLTAFEAQSATLQQDLKETDARLDSLTTEASLGSRLTVISNGDQPMTPSLDNRAKAAAAGALAGWAIPLGLLILRGNVRRRYRCGQELAEDLRSRVPFVALLPEVVTGGPLNSAASRCIHELCTLLQPENQKESRTYLVAGTAQGEGATSLALSLALSYAAAGFRTVVVDSDASSRRLTLGFGAGSSPGLLEALAGDDPVVHDVRAGMFVLAAGHGPTKVSLKLTTTEVSRVLAELRHRFDVILIDGEPILTGAAASVLVPQVDGVLLTVARGQEQSLIDSALKHTAALGGTVAGVVFNHAADSDFPEMMRESVQTTDESQHELPARLLRFGPLVGTVLSSLSLCKESDLDLIPVKSKTVFATARAA